MSKQTKKTLKDEYDFRAHNIFQNKIPFFEIACFYKNKIKVDKMNLRLYFGHLNKENKKEKKKLTR